MNKKEQGETIFDSNGRFVADCCEDNVCSKCNKKTLYYYELYDAFFCASCNEWHDKTCGDASCDYCNNRPDRPLS